MVEAAEGNDAHDHLAAAGHGLEDFVAVEFGAERVGAAEQEEGGLGAGRHLPLTDLGNGRRLTARHGADVRYCHPWRSWLVWDGRRWRRDDTAEAMRRAKDTALAVYEEAQAAADDTKRQRALAAHALRSQSAPRLSAMLAMAASEEGIPVLPTDLDADRWALNVQNGTLDLRTGALRAHRREDLITRLAPVEWHPEAESALWRACLACWLPDPEVQAFVQRVAGYALTGDVSEHALFFLYGLGANGKSVFVRTLLDLLGDYAMQAAPELLLAKREGGVPCDVAEIAGHRLVATIEVDEGRRLAESLVKSLTGGDRQKARFMRENFFEFEPTHTIFLVANHKPVVRGADYAMWRRIRVVPFEVTIPERERDPRLLERLAGERAGILRWAIEGCLAWQQEGLGLPEAVLAATDDYRTEMDPVGAWVEECCLEHPQAQASAAELWESFRDWAKRAGEEGTRTQTAFGRRLGARAGLEPGKGPAGRRVWTGIRLSEGS